MHRGFLYMLYKSEAEEGVVIFDPIAYGDGYIVLFTAANDHLVDTGVDDLALAHGAAHGIAHKLICAGSTVDTFS